MKNREFKTVTEKLGGHYHVSVFSAPGKDMTFAKLGTLVMDEDDHSWFTALFAAKHEVKS